MCFRVMVVTSYFSGGLRNSLGGAKLAISHPRLASSEGVYGFTMAQSLSHVFLPRDGITSRDGAAATDE